MPGLDRKPNADRFTSSLTGRAYEFLPSGIPEGPTLELTSRGVTLYSAEDVAVDGMKRRPRLDGSRRPLDEVLEIASRDWEEPNA